MNWQTIATFPNWSLNLLEWCQLTSGCITGTRLCDFVKHPFWRKQFFNLWKDKQSAWLHFSVNIILLAKEWKLKQVLDCCAACRFHSTSYNCLLFKVKGHIGRQAASAATSQNCGKLLGGRGGGLAVSKQGVTQPQGIPYCNWVLRIMKEVSR